MFYRPRFVTNSSSSGYYFFIPKDQKISHEFFDQIGLTPIYGDNHKIDSLDLLRDFLRSEEAEKESLAELKEQNPTYYAERLAEFTVPGLQATIKREIEWLVESKGKSWCAASYTKERIKKYSKLLGAIKRGYRIAHIEYADDAGSYSADMDYHSHGLDIKEKKGVGGVVTMSHH